MKKFALVAVTAAAMTATFNANAQFSLTPLSTFSPNNDGWLAPAEGGITYVATGDSNRGLAYGGGKLYLAYGGNAVRILDAATGGDLGNLVMTGVSGGARALNSLAYADGAVYGANLTTQATTSPYKAYKWSSDVAAPAVVYSGALLAAGRVGDNLDATGSGANVRLVAGFGSTPAVAGNNSYGIVDPTSNTGSAITFAGSPPAAGDFRLGISFGLNANSVIGSQGSPGIHLTSYSGTTGSYLDGSALFSTAERLLDFTTVNGLNLLATISTGDGRVRVYNMSDINNPAVVLTSTALAGLSANGNGTGAVRWGNITDNGNGTSSATLYALSSNQGIQAFTVVVPEPATGALLGIGLITLVALRRSRK